MCNRNALQRHIARRTNNGELVANFLADTIEGKHSDAKYHHKLEAAKLLNRYGALGDDPSHEETSQFWGLIPTPEELAASREDEQSPLSPRERVRVRGEENPPHPENPVSYLDILNYEIAHLIRTETAEGHTIAEFLSHVMTRRDQPFTPKKLRIRQTDRMAAAREILRRGHGHFGRKPKLTVYADDTDEANDYDILHTDLARRMREYNQHGTAATRFLLDVMSDTSLDPEEAYTWHHKMSAAHELIRRGWDTNYDNITPEMLQAYWQDQRSTRLSIGQKKHLAGLPTFTDEYDQYDREDYEAIANEIRETEAREAASLVAQSPLSPRERARVRGTDDTPSPSMGEGWDGGEESPSSSPSTSLPTCDESYFIDNIDDIDCYFEPLTPEEEAIFNYNSLIESGEFKEGEISIVPPSDAARRDYAIALKQIREAAAADGVPLMPNPLAGTLRHPTIRSP